MPRDPKKRRIWQAQYRAKHRDKICAVKRMCYAKRHAQYIEMHRKYREKHQSRVMDAKDALGGRCCHCGITDYDVLTFDHIDVHDKFATIGNMSGRGNEAFWEEVYRCRLLCFNCHHKHTLTQQHEITQKRTNARKRKHEHT